MKRCLPHHPTMVKVQKVLDLMNELGITLTFPCTNTDNIEHALQLHDGGNTYDLVGVENEGIDSFGKQMFDFKLIY